MFLQSDRTKVFPAPSLSIDWVFSRLFSYHGTGNNDKTTGSMQYYKFWHCTVAFLQIQKVCGSNVRGILFQGRDVYPDSLSAACLLSSPAVCCCCPSVVVLSWSVSLFKLPPSPDGPDGLPPIDGIVGFYSYYANPAHVVRYASIVCILTSVLKNANWLPAIHCWLVVVYAKTVMITSQF